MQEKSIFILKNNQEVVCMEVTVSQAAHEWVREFSRFPTEMIIRVASFDIQKFQEVTKDMEFPRASFPIWNAMWQFKSKEDELWLEEDNGIKEMSAVGFRIFKHDDFGYFFGLDGGGIDFYERYWIPLYKKRGLNWHNVKDEKEMV